MQNTESAIHFVTPVTIVHFNFFLSEPVFIRGQKSIAGEIHLFYVFVNTTLHKSRAIVYRVYNIELNVR